MDKINFEEKTSFLKHVLLTCWLTFFTFIACPFSVKASDDEKKDLAPKQQVCLMNDPASLVLPEWKHQHETYLIQKGMQIERLQNDEDGFNVVQVDKTYGTRPYHIRFVKSPTYLKVGYGLLRNTAGAIPSLELPDEIYGTLAKLGTDLKILRGYVHDPGKTEGTFTPDKTNIYIPHISFVIQWNENDDPILVPAGMLRSDKGIIAFMSGLGDQYGDEEDRQKLFQFYNNVYKEGGEDSVDIYLGKEVAKHYIPFCLLTHRNDLVGSATIFQDGYLSKIAENIQGMSSSKQKGPVYCAAHFLQLLFQNQHDEIFKGRQKTTKTLLDLMEDPKPKIKIAKQNSKVDKSESKDTYDKTSFIKTLQDNRGKFANAALKRIQDNVSSLSQEVQPKIQGLCQYINYALNPNLLNSLDEAKAFWKKIITLRNDFPECKNQHELAMNSIKVDRWLMKHASMDSHTEPHFIKLAASNPLLLYNMLTKIKTDNAARFQAQIKPNFLGVIVDSFSWLDTCEDCGTFLHKNPLWPHSLQNLRSQALQLGFSVSISPIDSLFRVIAREKYTHMPLNLSKAGGGSDYTGLGWDFRVLSELRHTLATRLPDDGNLMRDKIFERISSSMISALLTRPLKFWNEYPLLLQVVFSSCNRDNGIKILYLRFNKDILNLKWGPIFNGLFEVKAYVAQQEAK